MEQLISTLEEMASADEVEKVSRFYRGGDSDTIVMGIQVGRIFPVAKRFTALSLDEVEHLLDDNRYEVRMAAMAILDFKAQQKSLSEEDQRALFELYIRKHDRIDNWDLVDRAAPRVVGEHLVRSGRQVLDELAISPDPHRRRTALVATHAFIKRGEVEGTFRIATLLAEDPDDYVQKAIASWTREAGKSAPEALQDFLRMNKGRLPRTTVTVASKLLPQDVRAELMS